MRGAIGTVGWIVLGLIFLGIILFSTIGPVGLKRAADDFFEGLGIDLWEDYEEFSGYDAPVLARNSLVLSSDPSTAAFELAQSANLCYNYVLQYGLISGEDIPEQEAGNPSWDSILEASHIAPADQNTRLPRVCYLVDPSRLSAPVTRDMVVDAMHSMPVTGDPDTEPYSFFDRECEDVRYRIVSYHYDNEGWCIPEVINRYSGVFAVGGARMYDDYWFTFQFPEPVMLRRSLPSDQRLALQQLAAVLSRCWFSSDLGQGYDFACAELDPAALRQPITKDQIVAYLLAYLGEGPAEVLNDGWAASGMQYSIDRFTDPFFACSSDRGEGLEFLYSDDLCLTHDLQNDCCT